MTDFTFTPGQTGHPALHANLPYAETPNGSKLQLACKPTPDGPGDLPLAVATPGNANVLLDMVDSLLHRCDSLNKDNAQLRQDVAALEDTQQRATDEDLAACKLQAMQQRFSVITSALKLEKSDLESEMSTQSEQIGQLQGEVHQLRTRLASADSAENAENAESAAPGAQALHEHICELEQDSARKDENNVKLVRLLQEVTEELRAMEDQYNRAVQDMCRVDSRAMSSLSEEEEMSFLSDDAHDADVVMSFDKAICTVGLDDDEDMDFEIPDYTAHHMAFLKYKFGNKTRKPVKREFSIARNFLWVDRGSYRLHRFPLQDIRHMRFGKSSKTLLRNKYSNRPGCPACKYLSIWTNDRTLDVEELECGSRVAFAQVLVDNIARADWEDHQCEHVRIPADADWVHRVLTTPHASYLLKFKKTPKAEVFVPKQFDE